MRRGTRDKANRYELIGCALEGHDLVGTDVRVIEAADANVVQEHDGLRWYRCLRCDSWLPGQPPDDPTRERLPGATRSRFPCGVAPYGITTCCG